MKVRKPLTPGQRAARTAYQREWYRRNPEKRRANSRRDYARRQDKIRAASKRYAREHGHRQHIKQYGLSVDDYNRLFDAQDRVCAICRRPPLRKRLSVDHDHETGVVRGLLCSACNFGVGLFRDNPMLLDQAIRYLEQGNLSP